MKRIIELLFLSFIFVHSSNGGCPKATFEFKNQTKWASYNFIDSILGNIGSLETCPYTGRPYVYLPCYPNSSWGNEPYFSNCLKPTDVKIILNDNLYQNLSIEQISKLPMNDLTNVLIHLNTETMNIKSSSDVTSIVDIIDRIIMNNQNTDDIQSNLYSIANKLLSSEYMQEAQKMNGSFVKLLSLIDKYSQNLNFDGLEKTFINRNFALSIVNKPMNRTVGFVFDSIKNQIKPIHNEDNHHENSSFIILNSQSLIHQNRLIFSTYNEKLSLFDDKQSQILSRIVSLTIDKPELIQNLGSFVKIHFFIPNDFQDKKPYCAFWNISDDMTAQWSTDGCYLSNRTAQSVTCLCNHLTHFAVLTNIEDNSSPRFVEQILSLITLIGILICSVGLCLTILTFIFFKKLRRHFSQKSLLFFSLNLLCVNILFSIICLFTLKHLLCIIIASLLHYFILSTFSWMIIISLIQYLLFVKVFSNSISAFTRKAAIFSQLIPLIPVIIVLSLDPNNYTKRNDQICWLSNLPFYLSFILPIVLYILINTVMLTIVACSVICRKRLCSAQTLESQRLSRFTIALCCFIVLCLSWIFGLFVLGPKRFLFQILFCIFISLTGFFIFILYIITSKTKRSNWNNNFKSCAISSIYSPTSSSSSGFHGGKDYSTTSISDHQKTPSRHTQLSNQPQHFIDAYMPTSPPPPAPPLSALPQPSLLMEGDEQMMANHFYEPRHVWAPQTNYIYETNQPTTSLDDYSLFYASNHDATKL